MIYELWLVDFTFNQRIKKKLFESLSPFQDWFVIPVMSCCFGLELVNDCYLPFHELNHCFFHSKCPFTCWISKI